MHKLSTKFQLQKKITVFFSEHDYNFLSTTGSSVNSIYN